MGNDTNDNTGKWFSNPLPIMMVVLLAAGVVVKTVPLQSARPNDPERVKHVPTSQQDVEARLWQDPFAAVEKHEQLPDKSKVSTPHTSESLRAHVQALYDANPDHLTILAVSVFGGSYVEAAESRRRSRFAVVSALGFHQYYPENEDAIGYFHIDLPNPQSIPNTFDLVVPYEWYKKPDGANTSNVLVLWLNEEKLTSTPLSTLHALFKKLTPNELVTSGKLLTIRLIGPAGSNTLKSLVRESAALNQLPIMLQQQTGSTIMVFSPSASISDCDLYASETAKSTLPWDCFMPANQPTFKHLTTLPIVRTTGTDDVLAAALLWELWVRGVNRKYPDKGRCEDGLVLIGERDTEYGRTLSRYLADGFSERCGNTEPPPVRTFTYLRGLDGVLPDIDKPGSTAPSKDKSSQSNDLRAQLEDAPPEHAEGRSQFDYLRRLGDEIERLDQKKQFAKNGVKAIGIVGSDVYDKLLILQALRGRFKDKIFFTTDLDARYLHADQKDWARNLVVASNFGLSLRPTLQHSTLPFRDSYQTATYLATLMALTDQSGWPLAIEDWLPAALEQPLTPYKPRRSPAQLGAFQPSSAGWTNKMENWLRPKIFEIGRTEAVHLASPSVHNLTGWIEGANPDGITSPAANTTCDGDWKTCTSIEPDWPSRGFWPEHFQNILIMFCLGILLLCLLFFLANRRVNEVIRAAFAEPSPEWNPARVTIGAVIGAVAVVSAIIANVGSLLDDSLTKGIGEPFVWLEGVSVWPSLVLRFISLIAMLAIWCLFLMLMDKQKRSISQDFKIPLPHTRTLSRSRWAAALSGPHLDLALFDKDGKAAMSSGVQDANVGEKVFDVTVLWQNYLRATSWKEMTGWIAASLFIGAILVALAFQILGKPSFPHRGELVATLHQILVLLNALVLWLVIFWVGYEIRACARFIETLSGVSNKWPEQLLRQKEEETGVPCTYLDDYLDFQLIVRATKRIHWIIYLPFVSILFTVFARSNFFDAMDFPLALVFIIGSALGYSLYSARLLRKSADAARATALGNYERQLFETTRPHGNTPPVLIVRPKTKPAQQPISVEQIAILADRIRSTRDGVFAPFVQQPALQALLLPFGGYGSVQILEYLFKL